MQVHHVDKDKEDPELREILAQPLMAKNTPGGRRHQIESSIANIVNAPLPTWAPAKPPRVESQEEERLLGAVPSSIPRKPSEIEPQEMQFVPINLSSSDSITASEIKSPQWEENKQLQDYSSAMENHGGSFDERDAVFNPSPIPTPQRVDTLPGPEFWDILYEVPSSNLNDDLFPVEPDIYSEMVAFNDDLSRESDAEVLR